MSVVCARAYSETTTEPFIEFARAENLIEAKQVSASSEGSLEETNREEYGNTYTSGNDARRCDRHGSEHELHPRPGFADLAMGAEAPVTAVPDKDDHDCELERDTGEHDTETSFVSSKRRARRKEESRGQGRRRWRPVTKERVLTDYQFGACPGHLRRCLPFHLRSLE